MMEYIYSEELDGVKEYLTDSRCRIVYMKRKAGNYDIHIVCCQFSDKDELKAGWQSLMSYVSKKIQVRNTELIEIYNVYIVIFQPEISEVLLNEIEQNKYSSRKIILGESMPENKERLEEIISSKLFRLNIEKNNAEPFSLAEKVAAKFGIADGDFEAGLTNYMGEYARRKTYDEN